MTEKTITMGRPQIGPMINFRLSESDLAAVDAAAADGQLTRAAWLRVTIAQRAVVPLQDLPNLMRWMLDNQFSIEDVIDMVEKPWKYELEYLIFKTGYEVDLDEVGHWDQDAQNTLIQQLKANR